MARVTVQARITGQVQGVWYRGWTREQAERLGLSGWVRNETDGSVAALISGPADKVEAMVTALWRGPPAARVSGVVTRPADSDDTIAGFVIRR
ncbi:MAG: acylphosphatase [Alphaproteobacteria bacterium]|nr:MAG: acylphosphatase [Alphaproteobacteria bacterium]